MSWDHWNTQNLSRRRFLGIHGAAGLVAVSGIAPTGAAADGGLPDSSGCTITRVTSIRFESPRWKMIGKNSHLDVHGQFARDRALLVETDRGILAVGSSRAGESEAHQLVGADPLDFYVHGLGVISPLGPSDAVLWDLIGRVLEAPLWKLFGGFGSARVPVYDGSIYFADLLPEHSGRGIERILEEIDVGLEHGHRAFKIKVGRGFKWMEPEEGLQRDIDVVRAIIEHAGDGVRVGVDANNGFDPATTRRFLDEVDADLYFVEEMFPEQIDADLELREFVLSRGWSTKIADGESARDRHHFQPYIEAGALDVLQGDIRQFGFTELLELSRSTHSQGITLAPHNWGSFLGNYMQIALGRGIPNFEIAEMEPGENDLFDVSGFSLENGTMSVPDTPGAGVEFNPATLRERGTVEWVAE